MPDQIEDTDTLLTPRQVSDMMKVDVSTLYRWHRAGTFPAPIRIAPQSTRWRLADVRAAIAAMPRKPAKGDANV